MGALGLHFSVDAGVCVSQDFRRNNRPDPAIAQVLLMRGQVRTDSKAFARAIEDYDACLDIMERTGRRPDGRAAFSEFPSTFVDRGLAHEGLADWVCPVAPAQCCSERI